MVKISGLNHYYGKGNLRKQILFDLELELGQGQMVLLSGPSGCGKTTLLTLIGGLRSVQEGSLEILGQQLKGASSRSLQNLRKQIGYIFQAHNLVTFLNARQNVRLALELHTDWLRSGADQRAEEILTQVGLGEHLRAYPETLSGGQKQRVAIARALAARPRLILADEPTAALDRQSGREVVELMRKLCHQQGATVLMVTHDPRILDVADRIVEMEDGRLTAGRPLAVGEPSAHALAIGPIATADSGGSSSGVH
jgi:putative ABC transport system ATP-binding protein